MSNPAKLDLPLVSSIATIFLLTTSCGFGAAQQIRVAVDDRQ
jgi:hypothetical protein